RAGARAWSHTASCAVARASMCLPVWTSPCCSHSCCSGRSRSSGCCRCSSRRDALPSAAVPTWYRTMPIVLLRIDERLIHGQVVVGWCATLHPDRIVVVDDEIAASTWEQELYGLGLPDEIQAECHTVEESRLLVQQWHDDPRRTMVLTRTVEAMSRLAEGGVLQGREVNIGGLHHSIGRRQVLPYVFLSDAERAALRQLAEAGVQVSARDVPGARRVDLTHLLGPTGG